MSSRTYNQSARLCPEIQDFPLLITSRWTSEPHRASASCTLVASELVLECRHDSQTWQHSLGCHHHGCCSSVSRHTAGIWLELKDVPSRSRGDRDTSALLLLRAIQLDIAGMASAASLPTARARQGSIHTVSRRRSGNIRELCAALAICHLDGVISTWADFQEQKYAR